MRGQCPAPAVSAVASYQRSRRRCDRVASVLDLFIAQAGLVAAPAALALVDGAHLAHRRIGVRGFRECDYGAGAVPAPARSDCSSGFDNPSQKLLGAGMARSSEDLLGGVLLEDHTFVEEADAVSDLPGESHLVGGD